jgi:hypothetical protein
MGKRLETVIGDQAFDGIEKSPARVVAAATFGSGRAGFAWGNSERVIEGHGRESGFVHQ